MRMGIGLGVGINRSNYAQGIFNAYSARVVVDGGITEAGQCVDAVSGLLLNASLLLIPSGYKGGKLYSQIPTNGNGDLTWTRGSDAFRTNASGLIQRVPWNLLQRSEEFNDAVWNKQNASITANSTTSPDGNTTADKLIVNNSASIASSLVQQTITKSASSLIYSYTCYAKQSELNAIRIYVRDSISAANFAQVYYNINDGSVITAATSGGTFSSASSTITSVANEFYRINLTFTSSIDTQLQLRIYPFDTVKTTGNGTDGIFIWGAQLVEGTTAQTYLPTTDRLNFPRLSYMYGSCPAVLLEPQRTNLTLQSETFDNVSWVKVASTITANSTTSPDGNTNADKLVENAANSGHSVYQLFTGTNGQSYTASVYAKKSERDWILLSIADNFVDRSTYFNLTSGTVGTNASGSTATITNVGNGWYRCTVTRTLTSISLGIAIGLASADNTSSYTGNGTSGVFLYGAQLEAGAYATTYIPTTSATATRVADSFSRNNIFTNGLISASGGTWFVELRNNVAYTRDGAQGIGFNDTTNLLSGNGFIILNNGGLNRLAIRKYVSGTSSVVYTTTTDTTKIAIKWDGTSADIFANGTKVVSATSFTTTNMENLLGSGAGVPTFIQQMALYPSPLSDTDCTTITTL